jgi:hypothetical protein
LCISLDDVFLELLSVHLVVDLSESSQ